MLKYLVCLPYVWQPYHDACVATMNPELKKNVMFIDNTQNNLGIMKSHNMGIDKMREIGADWLIVMSASMRFGEPGGLDFIKIIEEHPDHQLIHGTGKWIDKGTGEEKVMALGWHLTAFRKDVFDYVGRWDENFTTYGFDDVDLYLRIKKFYGKDFKNNSYPVDCSHASTSHSIELAGVISPSAPLITYFVEKWGRHPSAWEWDGYAHPYNDPRLSLSYWPPATNGGRWDE